MPPLFIVCSYKEIISRSHFSLHFIIVLSREDANTVNLGHKSTSFLSTPDISLPNDRNLFLPSWREGALQPAGVSSSGLAGRWPLCWQLCRFRQQLIHQTVCLWNSTTVVVTEEQSLEKETTFSKSLSVQISRRNSVWRPSSMCFF